MKILVADDHPIVRQGLRQILEDMPDVSGVDEVGSGTEALEQVERETYDVMLLDVSMGDKSGLEVLRELKGKKGHVPVLVLSMYPEEQYGVRALRAGAAGYLMKTSASDELIKAIRRVAEGGKYITPTLAEKLVLELEKDTGRAPHAALSDREYVVMRLIAVGKAPKVIAEQLSLSIKTVSTYRRRILEKMGMDSNAELVRYSVKNGLLD